MPLNYIRVVLLFCICLPFTISAESQSPIPAPEFSLPRLDKDGMVNLSELKGKVVYLDFWATWCPPCRKSFPWMEEMHTRYQQDGLVIVAVSVDGKRELAEKFIKETGASFITAIDLGKKTAKAYKLRGMPSSYLIDQGGNIINTHIGFRTSMVKSLEEEIRKALMK